MKIQTTKEADREDYDKEIVKFEKNAKYNGFAAFLYLILALAFWIIGSITLISGIGNFVTASTQVLLIAVFGELFMVFPLVWLMLYGFEHLRVEDYCHEKVLLLEIRRDQKFGEKRNNR